uniref:Rab-GAP TBC domain-containing protein n=1 Tax=Acrobeloides nanus TaxID=290746 RepID=A0A914E1D9_9BILA
MNNGSVKYDESTLEMLDKIEFYPTKPPFKDKPISNARFNIFARKVEKIRKFLEEHKEDLHYQIRELRSFACSPGGLVMDEFRAQIWPILAENIPGPSDLLRDETESSCSDSDFESAVSTLSNFNEEETDSDKEEEKIKDVESEKVDDAVIVELPPPSEEDLKTHSEWNQVQMDVNRTLARFPPDITEFARKSLQTDLIPLIVRVLWENKNFRYYQGFHDICLTLILVLGVEDGYKVAKILSERSAFTNYLTGSLEKTAMVELQYLYVLLYKANMGLEKYLRGADLGTLFALSWPITWFSHSLDEYSDVVLCFDLFLSSHFLMPVYLGAALISEREDEIFRTEQEMPMLHGLLSHIPSTVDIGRVIERARDIYNDYPPLLATDHYRREYEKEVERDRETSRRMRQMRLPAETLKRKNILDLLKDPTVTAGIVLSAGVGIAYAYFKMSYG